ncbi:MAG: hypothetical protein VBE63_29265 [Lamprobacter sp.]|uniref:hypothetical protein n=1 Tax=Lamprobacter sp. TaxID=3100796 RepID=UPI002B25B18A|nr:hypothetical protein [Lamprobacter sp.]MEA3643981.1 hypothetical protein [Lamprobacter sp.]
MAITLQNYLDELPQADRLYHANWVVPYSNAYVEAHAEFKKTLADQAAYDKMMAEIAIMALTLPIGAGMSALFAKSGVASAKQFALSKTVDIICNKNMERTFNALSVVANSPAASYIADKAWDEAAGKLSTATKAKVSKLIQPMPLTTNTIHDPLVAKGNMERYLALVTASAHEIAQSLAMNDSLSPDQRNALAAKLMRAPLIKRMPYTANIPAKAAQYIELNMYMTLILENDIAESYSGGAVWGGASITTTKQPTNVPPSHADYPKPYNKTTTHGSGFATSAAINTRVIKVELGHKIWERINTIHKGLFGSPFYELSRLGVNGYEVTVKAENMSEKIHNQIRSHL